jgi:PAS domain-containing protein
MPGGSSVKRQRSAGADLAKLVDEALLEHFSPAAVVVTESLEVVETRGDLTPYPIRTGSEGILRGAAADRIRKALGPEGQSRNFPKFRFTTIPLPGQLYCVVFESRGLAGELRAAREQLSNALDESEVTTEELRSAVEELRVANEELQEANRELTAANQEVAHVNARTASRLREQQQAQAELEGILNSLRAPIVVLGPDLRIRRFTTQARQVFELKPSDAGKRIQDLPGAAGLASLEDACIEAMERLVPVARELHRGDGSPFPVLVRPFLAQTSHMDGVIVTSTSRA